MAYSINKVILVGNVGNDPEVKTFQSGDKVINFSIATSESWKNEQNVGFTGVGQGLEGIGGPGAEEMQVQTSWDPF